MDKQPDSITFLDEQGAKVHRFCTVRQLSEGYVCLTYGPDSPVIIVPLSRVLKITKGYDE